MRGTVLALGLVLVLGLIGAAGDGSVTWRALDDGSVAWPTGEQVDRDGAEAASPITCAIACSVLYYAVGCDIPGTQLDCVCSGGQVCCLYYRCLENPWWMFWKPCYCGTEMECTGIPCTPGQPIPEYAPRDLRARRPV
jgi:hypothetical protein